MTKKKDDQLAFPIVDYKIDNEIIATALCKASGQIWASGRY